MNVVSRARLGACFRVNRRGRVCRCDTVIAADVMVGTGVGVNGVMADMRSRVKPKTSVAGTVVDGRGSRRKWCSTRSRAGSGNHARTSLLGAKVSAGQRW